MSPIGFGKTCPFHGAQQLRSTSLSIKVIGAASAFASRSRRWSAAVILPLALILAWLSMGAGQRSGGEREAPRFAWQVEATERPLSGQGPDSDILPCELMSCWSKGTWTALRIGLDRPAD
jgi:hypothetical protein